MVDLLVDAASYRGDEALMTVAVRLYVRDRPEVERWAAVKHDDEYLAVAAYYSSESTPAVLAMPNRQPVYQPLTVRDIDLVRWAIEQTTNLPRAKSKPTKTWRTRYPAAAALHDSITSSHGAAWSPEWRRVEAPRQAGSSSPATGRSYNLVTTAEQLTELSNDLAQAAIVQPFTSLPIALDFETVGVYPFMQPVGYSFSYEPGTGYYVPLAHLHDENAPAEPAMRLLKLIVAGRWVAHNAIFEQHCLDNLGLAGQYNELPDDTMYLAWHQTLRKGLKDLSATQLARKRKTFEDVAKGREFNQLRLSEALEYACDDAIDTLLLQQMWEAS